MSRRQKPSREQYMESILRISACANISKYCGSTALVELYQLGIGVSDPDLAACIRRADRIIDGADHLKCRGENLIPDDVFTVDTFYPGADFTGKIVQEAIDRFCNSWQQSFGGEANHD